MLENKLLAQVAKMMQENKRRLTDDRRSEIDVRLCLGRSDKLKVQGDGSFVFFFELSADGFQSFREVKEENDHSRI